MLKQRVITALVILAVLLAALLWFPRAGWGIFTFAIVLIACWEWGRLSAFSPPGEAAYLALSVALGLLILAVYLGKVPGFNIAKESRYLFAIGTLFWLIAVPVVLTSCQGLHPIAAGIAGWFVLFPAWVALLMFRDISPWFLLTVLAIVWIADIGAYFTGKRFGKTKLAPAISPGKTWEGVAGGLICVMLGFFAWFLLVVQFKAFWAADFISLGLWLPAAFLAVAAISVVGDLFESWLKRVQGVKDSSGLLPGRGGVLDRIDALTAALPVAGCILFVLQPPP